MAEQEINQILQESKSKSSSLLRLTTQEELERYDTVVSHLDLDQDDKSSSSDSDDESVTLVLPKNELRPTTRLFQRKHSVLVKVDVEEYMEKRQMTSLQEKLNAWTMIPPPVYCIYYLLNQSWISESHQCTLADTPDVVWAVAVAFCIHAPFSFLYHNNYALQCGTHHWSRRLDQSMIHVGTTLCAYATSRSFDFFLANVLYSIDCIYRQFQEKVRPRRNKVRILISFVSYTLPILKTDGELFLKLWMVFALGGWLFGAYPIGGWSHAAFHLVMVAAPILLMDAALYHVDWESIECVSNR